MKLIASQRGDTLVEVSMALALLTLVLMSAFYLANRSIQLGRTAKERTLLVTEAQNQAESLMIMRDRIGWAAFSSAVDSLAGNCFYVNGSFNVVAGNKDVSANVPTGTVCIKSAFVSANMRKFNIQYTAQTLGGGPDIDTTLVTQLGNVDALRQRVVE